MFATNTVQAGAVPTLQYQEHPGQNTQIKKIENVQQKVSQPQHTQQQQQVNISTIVKSMVFSWHDA